MVYNFLKNCCVVLLFSVTALPGCQQEKQANKPANPLLIVSFDGFRYDYLEKTPTPNFDSLAANGVRAEGLIPIFPTKTFPNHYSIATGLYPEHTGLIANTMYDSIFGEWYRISNRQAVEDAKWYHGEPIWNTAEKQGLTAGTMFWVGSEAPIQGMRPTYWKRYDSEISSRARIDTVVKWLTLDGDRKVDFSTLYFELVDDAGHTFGTRSDSLIAVIRKADSLMGYLKRSLVEKGIWDRLHLIVLSDHGMVDLSAEKTIMLDSIVNMDHIERIVWAPVTMIQPKQGESELIYQQLKAAEPEKRYNVYKKEELPERFHLAGHRRVTEIVVVADPGYTLLSEENKPEFINRLPSATHGFDNRGKKMQAFFLAGGPAFKENITVPPFQNIHLYELMNYLLGTEPEPNDGSLDSVRVMLK